MADQSISPPLRAIALNSTLKASSSGEISSTDKMLQLVLDEMGRLGVEGEIVRLADHAIRPGVTSDEGEGDEWRRCANASSPPTS